MQNISKNSSVFQPPSFGSQKNVQVVKKMQLWETSQDLRNFLEKTSSPYYREILEFAAQLTEDSNKKINMDEFVRNFHKIPAHKFKDHLHIFYSLLDSKTKRTNQCPTVKGISLFLPSLAITFDPTPEELAVYRDQHMAERAHNLRLLQSKCEKKQRNVKIAKAKKVNVLEQSITNGKKAMKYMNELIQYKQAANLCMVKRCKPTNCKVSDINLSTFLFGFQTCK
ncbi:hypothetical protein RFI_14662 [Reticulomyxa filosa]|uniref:Uncharacterized protein n=1 Tax=Reticulomyxa filosa TaxID=46433 RepID=X6NB45_RETFI|nr:hypothetical protein RFI_14662 [Reticulomyxa filosa]|eukprot:ETO22537.1 hypothetical protein RFI_14662 [Reticulomyxa filosa]